MPRRRYRHCLVRVSLTDDSSALMIAGSDQGSSQEVDEVFAFDFKTQSWSQTAPLGNARESPFCGTIIDSVNASRKMIIVAGGEALFSPVTSTEILQLNIVDDIVMETDVWMQGPDLAGIDTYGTGATATSSDRTRLVIAAAWVMFQIRCFAGDCQWTKLAHELAEFKHSPVAVIIPPGILHCFYALPGKTDRKKNKKRYIFETIFKSNPRVRTKASGIKSCGTQVGI